MASYSVNIVKVANKKGYNYRIEDRLGKKRIRENAGPNRQEAEKIRATRQHQLLFERNKLAVQDKTVKPLQSLIDNFLKEKEREVRAQSMTRYKNYLERFATFFKKYFPDGYADVARIEKSHIQEFIEHLQNDKKPWAPKTLNGFIRLAKTTFKTAIDEKYIEENPFEKVKEFRLASKGMNNHFSKEDLIKIWAEVDQQWRPCLEFIYLTGIRKGEMINLLWENVDLDSDSKQISVVSLDDWETKTGKNRSIPLALRAQEILAAEKDKHDKYVFVGDNGKQIHPDRPYKALKNALDKLGLKGNVHKLRHTFASHLSMAGVEIPAIMELMGHTDSKTTLIYARPDKKYLQTVVTLLDAVPEEENINNLSVE
jgi:site-specific recombinase XerD